MKKMKKLLIVLLTASLVATVQAQTIQIPTLVGQVITYQGQQFLLSTNAMGGYQVSTIGVQGTNVFVVPATSAQAMDVVTAWINQNNPANAGYYGTNEWEARLGAAYLQNSGQAVATLSVGHWGWPWQNVGAGIGILQGNNGGKSGTAGAYGEIDYRKIIGDVAGVGGIIGGYDNWNAKPFIGGKVGLEYRQNAHLGEYVDADYAFETGGSNDRGLLISGGISYAF